MTLVSPKCSRFSFVSRESSPAIYWQIFNHPLFSSLRILIVCSTVLFFFSSEILHAQDDLNYDNEDLKLVTEQSLATGQAQETTVPEF